MTALTDPLKTEVRHVRLSSIRPCPENDKVYGKQSLDDPDIISLIKSIRANGLLEPISISVDNFIISGHRRRFCAHHAGLGVVPVIRHDDISYAKDREAFLKRLVEANTQRVKTAVTVLREAAMQVDHAQAVAEMRQEQKDKEEERLYGSQVADHLFRPLGPNNSGHATASDREPLASSKFSNRSPEMGKYLTGNCCEHAQSFPRCTPA